MKAAAIGQGEWLATLAAQIPRAAAGEPEGVHLVRVALARLRVFLDLSRDPPESLDTDLRWLRGRAAALRDLDIQLARPDVPPAFATLLGTERDAAEAHFRAAISHPRAASIGRALAELPAIPRKRAERGLARLADHALAYGDAVRDDDAASLHALRRAVRRTRFAVEWLGRSSEHLVALQATLGAFNDGWIALARAKSDPKSTLGPDGAREVEIKGMRRYRRNLENDLRETVRGVARAWRRARPELVTLAMGLGPELRRVAREEAAGDEAGAA